MKKFVKLFTLVCFFALCLVLTSCGKPKEVDNSQVKAYSMDLTDIAGYSDAKYKVTNGTWAETYDVIIAAAKKEQDATKREALYHKAEDLLMSTGCIVPVYYYTDIYMKKENVSGFFANATGTKFFKGCKVGTSDTTMTVCLASEPDTIDPALNSSVDGATLIAHCFTGLTTYVADPDNAGKAKLVLGVADDMEKVVNADGTVTYTFHINDNAKWSDKNKTAVKPSDFKYAWDRAVNPKTAADYGYLFEIVKGYDAEKPALATTADDTNNNFSFTLVSDVPYIFDLLAFPTFMPVSKTAVEAGGDAWATDPEKYVTNGAYKLTAWTHDSKITLTKNDNYSVDGDTVTMKEIVFALSDDDTAILTAYRNNQYQFIDTVPNNEIETLKADYAKEYFVDGQLGTYYVIFNNNTDLLPSAISKEMTDVENLNANEEIRNALSLLIDRNYICENIGKAGQEPAASFVGKGITNADGSEFYKSANKKADGSYGYYSVKEDDFEANCAAAVAVLKKYFKYSEKNGEVKFSNVPTITYLYNEGTGHKAIAEYIQSAFKAYGITVKLESQEWNTFLNTRKDGDFTIARNGWLADFNDPISFLDMWTSGSGNNDAQFGK